MVSVDSRVSDKSITLSRRGVYFRGCPLIPLHWSNIDVAKFQLYPANAEVISLIKNQEF
jgi:hypothetical protein